MWFTLPIAIMFGECMKVMKMFGIGADQKTFKEEKFNK